ncbi:MAG: arginase family protein [Solirubrobacterales bacterium]|nr:arginase family protein [Solirubrobacterales bacterium]
MSRRTSRPEVFFSNTVDGTVAAAIATRHPTAHPKYICPPVVATNGRFSNYTSRNVAEETNFRSRRNLAELRAAGIENAENHAAAFLAARALDRVWLHLDADCLDDAIMPAVDRRIEGGLAATEVIALVRPLLQRGLISGMDATIYNPSLDSSDFAAGRVLLDVIEQILD